MRLWYEDSEKTRPLGTGECNVPAMSMLMGLIMGNNISRVAQCGHYIGFSTLLLGFMMRRMSHQNSVFSVDIDPYVSAYTSSWVQRAGLEPQVRIDINDSANPQAAQNAKSFLKGAPQVVFIDSSHEYDHTIRELDLWYPLLQPGGFIALHDVSQFAVRFDAKKGVGVKGALQTWVSKHPEAQTIFINDFCTDQHFGERTVYKDASGLGIIQKPS